MHKPSFLLPLALLAGALAQDTPEKKPDPQPQAGQPQIKYNYLNVCSPTEDEQKEIKAALDRIPARMTYSGDFEITRGRTSMQNAQSARYVRLRREVTDGVFGSVQYSLSNDPEQTVETLILKFKEPKDMLLVSLEDQITAGTAAPSSVLQVDTPISRIKLERFGKSSLVLARCEGGNQSAYEPLFLQASKIAATYRKNLGLRTMFRGELAWLSAPAEKKPAESKPKTTASAPEAKPAEKKN